MTTLLSIDPGKFLGYAVFKNSILSKCGLVTDPGMQAADIVGTLVDAADVCVLEKPQIYPGRRQKGDPNDLINLAMIVGVVAGRYTKARLLTPTPREWKGTVPKLITEKRVLARLAEAENIVLVLGTSNVIKSRQHNVIDAVGLGLWALGRT